jgi:tetratricopeptide (TPR) repeat protein
MVLPFAYVQALFADQQYSKAAKVLQEALSRLSPDQEGIFYPRGLYTNDDILFEQIERLEFKASLYPLDTDLQLLLGYQLLGVNRLDQAIEPLQLAGQDPEIEALSTVMLDLLEKIKGNKS